MLASDKIHCPLLQFRHLRDIPGPIIPGDERHAITVYHEASESDGGRIHRASCATSSVSPPSLVRRSWPNSQRSLNTYSVCHCPHSPVQSYCTRLSDVKRLSRAMARFPGIGIGVRGWRRSNAVWYQYHAGQEREEFARAPPADVREGANGGMRRSKCQLPRTRSCSGVWSQERFGWCNGDAGGQWGAGMPLPGYKKQGKQTRQARRAEF